MYVGFFINENEEDLNKIKKIIEEARGKETQFYHDDNSLQFLFDEDFIEEEIKTKLEDLDIESSKELKEKIFDYIMNAFWKHDFSCTTEDICYFIDNCVEDYIDEKY